LFCVRSKTKGEVRLDDNETRISGARRAQVTGVGAWVPSCRGFGIAKILRGGNFILAKAAMRWMLVEFYVNVSALEVDKNEP
jgi:hypothetical protein